MPVQSSDSLPADYEQLHVGVALYDPATARVLDANGRLETLLGYATATLKRLTVDEYSANTYDYSCTRLRRRFLAAADGDSQAFRWRIKRGDGTLVWVQVHLSGLTLDDERRVLAEVRDIEAYTTASRRVGLLSRIMRHNLRNDLTVISGRAERIAATDDPGQVRRHVEKIHETASDIDRMTDSVRQIERATTPGTPVSKQQRAVAAVNDDCPPIPPVEIDALDAPGENTSTAHGTGVGLFVMKWSIESLGGEIAFDNADDRGNVVSFYLPPETPPDATS